MKFQIDRETFLDPVSAVIGVVERRQTMPILSNVQLVVDDQRLAVTGTDLEVELRAAAPLTAAEAGEITVPGRKLMDILKALPDKASVSVQLERDRLILKAGKSRFTLSTLPATEFPIVDDINTQVSFEIDQAKLKQLIDLTGFSMAQQDVRYYLNGLLLEIDPQRVRAVATDGHRLALSDCGDINTGVDKTSQVIVPRKGVLELARLLGGEGHAKVDIGSNHIRVSLGEVAYTSKLIDGRFPDYDRVIPAESPKVVIADRLLLKEALGRAAILSNEKYRGIRLSLFDGLLKIQAHNPEQEEAEEELEVTYSGDELEIGFNVVYLMDALSAVHNENVEIRLNDPNSSCLIVEPGKEDHRYVVMPMRL